MSRLTTRPLPQIPTRDDIARSRPRQLHPLKRIVQVGSLTPIATLGIFLTFAIRADLPAADAARGIAVIILIHVLPGAVVWRCVRPREGSWWEDLIMGFAVGACIAVAAQTAAGALQTPWVGTIVGPSLAGALMLARPTRKRIARAETSPLPAMWGPLVSLVVLSQLLATQAFYRTIPLTWAEGFRGTYVDLPFHQALAGQLAHRGPFETPFVLGEGIYYHWFSHAWIAHISVVGGVPIDAVLVRLLPPVITVVAILSVAVAGTRIAGRPWAGPLAALLAVAAGDLDVFGSVRPGALVSHLSPSTGLSVPLIAALLIVLVCRWRSSALSGSVLVLAALAFVAAGMKGSALPVVLAGTLAAGTVGLLTRHPDRRKVVLDAVILSGVFLLALLIVFRGGEQGLALDPTGAAQVMARHLGINTEFPSTSITATAALMIITLLASLARGAGIAALFTNSADAQEPSTWLLLGSGLAGAAAVLLLSHGGLSQLYFMRSAGPALAIGSAIGVVRLLEVLGPRAREVVLAALLLGGVGGRIAPLVFGPIRQIEADTAAAWAALGYLIIFALIVSAGAVALAMVHRAGPAKTVAWTVAIVAVLAAATAPVLSAFVGTPLPASPPLADADAQFAMSADQIRAARWIRDRSAPSDVIITNRHCSAPNWVNCDSRRFHVAAYTERRVLVEGWAYTYNRQNWANVAESDLGHAFRPFWNPDLLALNDRFFTAPTDELAAELYDLGVRWAFVDLTVHGAEDLSDHAELRFETEWAKVYALHPPMDGETDKWESNRAGRAHRAALPGVGYGPYL